MEMRSVREATKKDKENATKINNFCEKAGMSPLDMYIACVMVSWAVEKSVKDVTGTDLKCGVVDNEVQD